MEKNKTEELARWIVVTLLFLILLVVTHIANKVMWKDEARQAVAVAVDEYLSTHDIEENGLSLNN